MKKNISLLFMIFILLTTTFIACFKRGESVESPKVLKIEDADSGALSLYTLKNFWGEQNDAIVSFNNQNKTLKLYKENNEKLETVKEITLDHFLWKLCLFESDGEKKIAVALGYGRNDLEAPIKVYLYDKNLENEKLIYEVKSPRSQITFLEQVGSQLYINYFNSKYFTVLGSLKQVTNDKWYFSKITDIRLGSNVSIDGENILFARPYKDPDGTDAENILLDKNMNITNIPSFRGARSGIFTDIDNDGKKEILLGDGWHQNYGKLAEPRLSIVKFNEKTKQYDLTMISNIKGQISIEKIIPFKIKNTTFVLTAGEKFVELYEPQNDWKRTRIFENTSSSLDVTYAVLNGKPKIVVAL